MCPDLRIGTAGWGIPRELSKSIAGEGKHLDRYARVFNCSEINSSFHRPHSEKTWVRWRESAPSGFQFSVKAPKTITHEAMLLKTDRLLQDFFVSISALEGALGPVLFQFPPKLAFDAAVAEDFFDEVRRLFAGEVVCEPRHASWFDGEADDLLRQHRVARVAADPPRMPAAARPGGWTGLRYYRLHGFPRMYYSLYASDYLERLAADLSRETSPAWCIFDNTASGAALGNALELQQVCARRVQAA